MIGAEARHDTMVGNEPTSGRPPGACGESASGVPAPPSLRSGDDTEPPPTLSLRVKAELELDFAPLGVNCSGSPARPEHHYENALELKRRLPPDDDDSSRDLPLPDVEKTELGLDHNMGNSTETLYDSTRLDLSKNEEFIIPDVIVTPRTAECVKPYIVQSEHAKHDRFHPDSCDPTFTTVIKSELPMGESDVALRRTLAVSSEYRGSAITSEIIFDDFSDDPGSVVKSEKTFSSFDNVDSSVNSLGAARPPLHASSPPRGPPDVRDDAHRASGPASGKTQIRTEDDFESLISFEKIQCYPSVADALEAWGGVVGCHTHVRTDSEVLRCSPPGRGARRGAGRPGGRGAGRPPGRGVGRPPGRGARRGGGRGVRRSSRRGVGRGAGRGARELPGRSASRGIGRNAGCVAGHVPELGRRALQPRVMLVRLEDELLTYCSRLFPPPPPPPPPSGIFPRPSSVSPPLQCHPDERPEPPPPPQPSRGSCAAHGMRVVADESEPPPPPRATDKRVGSKLAALRHLYSAAAEALPRPARRAAGPAADLDTICHVCCRTFRSEFKLRLHLLTHRLPPSASPATHDRPSGKPL